MNKKFLVDIPIAWEYVRSVRDQVNEMLADYPEELRSASAMVASELVENAIKYGVSVPNLTWARVSFEMTPNAVRIEVSNGLTDATVFAALKLRIDEMREEGAGERRYLERLQELIDDPLPPNRLGLYRISFEGRFSLDCAYQNQVLTVKAHRQVL